MSSQRGGRGMWLRLGSWALVVGVAALGLARADEGDLRGRSEGTGMAASRNTKGVLSISGASVTYTFHYSSHRYRRVPSMTIIGTRSGDDVSFRIGTSAGMTDRLAEAGGSEAVRRADIVDFKGYLRVRDGKVEMKVKGSRSVDLHNYKVRTIRFSGPWTEEAPAEEPSDSAEAEGGDTDNTAGEGEMGAGEGESGETNTAGEGGEAGEGGDDEGWAPVEGSSNDEAGEAGEAGEGGEVTEVEPAEPVVERLKLGREGVELVAGKTFEVVVPLAGTLRLKADAGTVKITRPDGEVLEASEAEVSDSQIGTYKVEVAEGSGSIKATFVQSGRIDSRIRPWSSHTWYPVNHYSSGTSENRDTMFHKGGPMEKFDEVFKFEGPASAQNWEINGYGNRTSLAFENGHYARIGRPQESNWIVDCNLNGIRRYESDEEFMKTVDTDEDGFVSREELVKDARKTALVLFWAGYEKDGDGFITEGEISSSFIKGYDKDDDGKLSREEWDAALEKDYVENLDRVGEQEVERTFAERDRDGDGKLSEDEASPANGRDVIDSGDQDGDGRDFMDTDNIVLVMEDGSLKVGNRMEKKDGEITLFKGYKKDEEVGVFKEDEVKKVLEGVADGKYTGSYSVGWWGHCNAWALAAIMYQCPKEPIEYEGVTFSVRDQKALLVALAMRDTRDSSFWWQQWGNKDEMPDQKYAAGFHNQLKKWLRDEQKGVMADMDLKPIRQTTGFQVWNYPLLGYSAEVREADGDDPYVVEMTVDVQKGSYSDEDSESSAELTYTLHFDEGGQIRDDEDSKTDWTTRDGWGDDAPKGYVRYLIHPYDYSGSLSSANPKVTPELLEKIFGGELKRNSLETLREEEAAAAAAGE